MNAQQKQPDQRAVVPVGELPPSRLPITPELATQLGVSPTEWRVLTDSIFPGAKTVEAVALAINYCRSRGLDPLKRPVNIVSMYSSLLKRMVETVWPSITEIRTTAARTKVYAGIDDAEFGPTIAHEFIQIGQREDRSEFQIKRVVEYPEWCRVVVYRIVGGQRCPFAATVRWTETYASVSRDSDTPNEMWRKRPFGQIEKCAEAAALRKAFPEEIPDYTAEEMAGRVLADDSEVPFVAPPEPAPAPRPPRAKTSKPAEDAPKAPYTENDIIDGEVITDPPDNDGGFVFFDRLRDAMAVATNLETLEEIWNEFDPLARFENNSHAQDTCNSIRAFQERRIAKLTEAKG